MFIKVQADFKNICTQILQEDKTIEEWAELESDDMFNVGTYSGGFDATEMEFCFSTTINETEYWFQLSLDDVLKVSQNKLETFEIRVAEN